MKLVLTTESKSRQETGRKILYCLGRSHLSGLDELVEIAVLYDLSAADIAEALATNGVEQLAVA
jgi:hypothetical protein